MGMTLAGNILEKNNIRMANKVNRFRSCYVAFSRSVQSPAQRNYAINRSSTSKTGISVTGKIEEYSLLGRYTVWLL
jgi:hypothetical protein